MRMDVEARTQAIGRELFERTRRAASVAERWTGVLFEGSLGHDEARLQLFRFIDVLPALGSDAEVAGHLREYFEGRPAPFPRLVRAVLALSSRGRLGERVVGAVLRETVRRLARRFIVGATPEEAVRAASAARRRGEGFTLDVLGEACVSEAEATAYHRRYLDLIEAL